MEWIRQIARLCILIALQIFLFNRLQLGCWGYPMVYILFLINLPAQTPRWAEMLTGFTIGMIFDLWFSSLGIHTAACVAISYLRPLMLGNFLQESERLSGEVRSLTIGRIEYLKLAIILVVIHHFIVFALETWNFQNWWMVLVQTLVSSIFTLVIVLGYDFLRGMS